MLKLIIISLICGLSIGQIGNFKSVKELMFFVVFVYSPVFHCIVVLIVFQWININYHDVTSARSCNKVGHLFWFTILAQHETDDVILYIHSVHKHRGNVKITRWDENRSLNWINSMQVKKILFLYIFLNLLSYLLSFLFRNTIPLT